jgi:hypothetical protein
MRAILRLSRELVLDIPDEQLERGAEIIRAAANEREPTSAFRVMADHFGMVQK